jgi:hypothetical protein
MKVTPEGMASALIPVPLHNLPLYPYSHPHMEWVCLRVSRCRQTCRYRRLEEPRQLSAGGVHVNKRLSPRPTCRGRSRLGGNAAPPVPLMHAHTLDRAAPLPTPAASVRADVPARRADPPRRRHRSGGSGRHIRRRRGWGELAEPVAQALLAVQRAADVGRLLLLGGGEGERGGGVCRRRGGLEGGCGDLGGVCALQSARMIQVADRENEGEVGRGRPTSRSSRRRWRRRCWNSVGSFTIA